VTGFKAGSAKEPFPLLPGEVRLQWNASGDDKDQGEATAYRIYAKGPDKQTVKIPAWQIPIPQRAGTGQQTVIEGLMPGMTYTFSIQAVDEAGNASPPAVAAAKSQDPYPENKTAAKIAAWRMPGTKAVPAQKIPLSSKGGFKAWPVPPGCKIGPIGGNLVEDGKEAYASEKPMGSSRAKSHVWDPKKNSITLEGGRQEFVAFQIGVERTGDPVKGITISADPWKCPGNIKPRITFFRYQYVQAFPRQRLKKGQKPKPYKATPADYVVGPLVELTDTKTVDLPVDERMPWQKVQGFWADVWIPPKSEPGSYSTVIKLNAGGDTVEFPLQLTVHPYRLPDKIRFVLSLNCYGVPGGTAGNPPLQRMAHAHRGVLNGLICNRGGNLRGVPLKITGQGKNAKVMSFEEFDKFWGPYFDGSAFKDMPRSGVPLDHFYFPLEMRFPVKLDAYYDDTKPSMEEAFTSAFRVPYIAAARHIIQHYADQGWNKTKSHMYLNYSFKKPSAQTTSYFSMFHFDESKYRSDYQAHAIYAGLLKEAKKGMKGIHVGYRIDIGRNEFMRTYMDGLLDLNVSSGGSWRNPGFNRLRTRRFGEEMWSYGGGSLKRSAILQRAWALKAFSLGANGIMPWNSVGKEGTHFKAQDGNNVCLIYVPSERLGTAKPSPSVRLKMLRRGVQDVELLLNVMEKHNISRFQVEDTLKKILSASSEKGVTLDAAGVAYLQKFELTQEGLEDLRKLLIKLAVLR
jgi:hypothetical protein